MSVGQIPIFRQKGPQALNGFRLSLSSSDPVPTADVTAATLVYVLAHKHNAIALYNGASWVVRTPANFSLAVPATTGTNYDVFLYDNPSGGANSVSGELVAWSGDTTRATALTRQDGVWVQSGDATRRYVGTFRTTGTSGQTEDSEASRFLWNVDNQVRVGMVKADSTDHTYNSGIIREWNGGSGTYVLKMVIGIADDIEFAYLGGGSQQATGVSGVVGFNVDSVGLTGFVNFQCQDTSVDGAYIGNYRTVRNVSAGFHTVYMCEQITGTGTMNFDIGIIRAYFDA